MYLADWITMCSNFSFDFNSSVNLVQAQDSRDNIECSCNIRGEVDADLVDLRLNYDRETCSSSLLNISVKGQCNQSPRTGCGNSFICDIESTNFAAIFLKRKINTNIQSLYMRTATCPASMVWIKLTSRGMYVIIVDKVFCSFVLYSFKQCTQNAPLHLFPSLYWDAWRLQGYTGFT